MTTDDFSSDSSLREKVLEHIFIGDLLRCLWRRNQKNIEVLRAEVDAAGYDMVLEYGEIIRHIQLKSSYADAKTSRVNLHSNLASKAGGCVIWLWYDPHSMQLVRFLWLGGKPNEKIPSLGDKIGRHSKGTSTGFKNERPNIRVVNKGVFQELLSIDAVADALFGPPE